MSKVAFYTLGCKVNAYDTEAMREIFKARGYEVVDFTESADIYIVNTCTVTHLGDRKSRQMLRRAKRKNPDALVVATGCYAQVNPEKLREIPEVDLIVGNRQRKEIVEAVENLREQVEGFSKDEKYEPISITESGEHTRAYVKIQDGCNQYCSYCIVPYARGPVRSRSEEDILDEIKKLAENGYREIVLTGIHIASFGKDRDEEDALITLIEKIEEVDGIERVRLSSLEPSLITEDFILRLKNCTKICPHFHLSLQSGSGSVLERMRRRYTPEMYREKVEIIRGAFPDPGITTDIIVGFPGETEEEFLETLEFVDKIGFSRIHIFPFSPREGTRAATMSEQVDDPTKKSRSTRLSDREKASRLNFYSAHDGKQESVLFERESRSGYYSGYTKNYIPVEMKSSEDLSGQIKTVELIYDGTEIMKAK